jgi:hypothetical protein
LIAKMFGNGEHVCSGITNKQRFHRISKRALAFPSVAGRISGRASRESLQLTGDAKVCGVMAEGGFGRQTKTESMASGALMPRH